MTTLISWITYDQNKQSSLYIASDSRLSWSSQVTWDSGRKVYCSSKYPDILGYCGDVTFCSQITSQVMTYIDSCEVFEVEPSPHQRFQLIYNLIKRSFGAYPTKCALDEFSIIYATRIKKYSFAAFEIKWSKAKGWESNELKIPNQTGIITASGSGGGIYKNRYRNNFERSDISGYSRSYYSCLYHHVISGDDPLTGGPIQLAGIFNTKAAIHHGVLMGGARYIYGMEVDETQNMNCVRWINENFENCDGQALVRHANAQRQPLPKNIGKPLGKDSRRKPLPR
ncbi:hypothetical protein ACFOJE_20360 [Azotobacter bryophylli]|uniref:Uncharacterized protein n=1 Tax=Azotobacter bryophylli TaxID=1986537 RepID=A0ABV7AYK6_9GAMM